MAVETSETCKAHGSLKLLRQITCGSSKHQVGSETVAVHALVKVTAMFSRSSSAVLIAVISEYTQPGDGVDNPVLEDRILRHINIVRHVSKLTKAGIFVHHANGE